MLYLYICICTNHNTEGQVEEVAIESGTLSPHYGEIQHERQRWLFKKARQLRLTYGIAIPPAAEEEAHAQSTSPNSTTTQLSHGGQSTAVLSEPSIHERSSKPNDEVVAAGDHTADGGDGGNNRSQEDEKEGGKDNSRASARNAEEKEENRNARRKLGSSRADKTHVPEELEGGSATAEERIERLELGAELWGATYVPAIEPSRRQALIEKWSPPGDQQVYPVQSFNFAAADVFCGGRGGIFRYFRQLEMTYVDGWFMCMVFMFARKVRHLG